VAGILRKSNGMTVQLQRKFLLQLKIINNPKYMCCKLTFWVSSFILIQKIYFVSIYFKTITNSTQQGPSWEANSSSASQAFPRLVWKPKVRHGVHRKPSPVPILSQINTVQARTLFLENPSYYPPAFQVASLLRLSPPNPCMLLISLPYVLHAQPIHNFIVHSNKIWWLQNA